MPREVTERAGWDLAFLAPSAFIGTRSTKSRSPSNDHHIPLRHAALGAGGRAGGLQVERHRAAGADRGVIEGGAARLGMSLEDLVRKTIDGMRAAADTIGLAGAPSAPDDAAVAT